MAGVLLGEYVPDKALALLDHGMPSKPGNAELLAARGYVRSLTNDLDGALVDPDAALAIRPDARTLAIKGDLLMQREPLTLLPRKVFVPFSIASTSRSLATVYHCLTGPVPLFRFGTSGHSHPLDPSEPRSATRPPPANSLQTD